jgi:hypothetical protein
VTTALVPTFAGRPPWLKIDGVWVCVAVHDAAYFADRTRWRALLSDHHPDHNAYVPARARWGWVGSQRWNAKLSMVRREQARYAKFYQSIGLSCPRPAQHAPDVDRFARCGHPRTDENSYLGRYPTYTVRQCRICALTRAARRYVAHPRSDGRICPQGHPRIAANIYPPESPCAGRCRICACERARRQRLEQKESIPCAA